MKKIYLTFLLSIAMLAIRATSYNITVVAGPAYSTPNLTVNIGDVVTISASANHPLVEVDLANYNAGTPNAMSGGWGTKTSAYTFTITSSNSIYYGCGNHMGMGMKGKIDVSGGVGIFENKTVISNISLFPNPAKEKLNLKINTTETGVLTAKLFSICGQEVQQVLTNKELVNGENTLSFDINKGIPAGVYFMELNFNSKKYVRKVVID